MYIAIDFDGTIVEHEYPEVGKPVPSAIEWIKQFVLNGAQIILWTMRSDGDRQGPTLTHAIDYLKTNGIELFGVNNNPTQSNWTSSPKAYAHAYIDDAAVGCPLRPSLRMKGRSMVDWGSVGPAVLAMIIREAKS